MDVALTGATGFVGSYTARALVEAGHRVRALVRPGREAAWLRDLGIHISAGDLTDADSVRSLVAGADAVIHTAFDHAAFDEKRQLQSFRTNLLGSLTLLELTRQAGVKQFICTVSTYILRPDVEYPNKVPQELIDESSPWAAAWNTYVCHNVVLETHCDAYRKQFGMNTTRFRCAWIYGVHAKPEESVWRSILEDVKASKRFESAFGCDVVAVQDVAAALAAAVGNPRAYGEVFNLSDMFLYNQEVALLAKEITGSSAAIVKRDLPKPPPIRSEKVKRLGVDVHRGIEGVRKYLVELSGADSCAAVMSDGWLDKFKRQRELWIQCLDGEDRHSVMKQIYHMIWNTATFRVINEARRIAPRATKGRVRLNPLIHGLINEGFFEGQMLAIRRLTDNYPITGDRRGRDVFSLISVLEDMGRHTHLMTRAHMFAAEGLEYDVALVRQRSEAYSLLKIHEGVRSYFIPRELDYHLLANRHGEIDFLAGATTGRRSPDDAVRPVVIDSLKKKVTDACKDLRTHIDKFVAHAASPESRRTVRADDALITLNHLYRAHEAICAVANFLDRFLLTGGSHGLLAIPQYNQFEDIDRPLVDKEGMAVLKHVWDEYEKETQIWTSWGIEGFQREFPEVP